jgi:hypothetical protein
LNQEASAFPFVFSAGALKLKSKKQELSAKTEAASSQVLSSNHPAAEKITILNSFY